MAEDARFSDADPRPMALRAEDADDLRVISALVQDAVLTGADLTYEAKPRRMALLVNRFRWEDFEAARAEGRGFERVRSLLVIGDVLRVSTDGVARDPDTVLELLTLQWTPGEDGTGQVTLAFAGDGTIVLDVECIAVDLRDVTRPYLAPSGMAPNHPD